MWTLRRPWSVLAKIKSTYLLSRPTRRIRSFSTAFDNCKATNVLLPLSVTLALGWTIADHRLSVSSLGSATRLEAAKSSSQSTEDLDQADSFATVLNWSGTHAVDVPNHCYFEPETVREVEDIVRKCHETGQPIRPVGSALSPNGLALHAGGMLSVAHLNHILDINVAAQTVSVQAGARVVDVIDALRPYHLTLPNLASIAEQQMGGFVNVSAHGTGRTIAPLDHYVTSLTLVTPARGTLVLTDRDGDVFHLAKVGLGCLGIVTELTIQCVPAHQLTEHTFVLTRAQAREQSSELLQRHRHVRYMWIPYADAVVVVTNDPEKDDNDDNGKDEDQGKDTVRAMPAAKEWSRPARFQPLTDLLIELTRDHDEPFTHETVRDMSFGALRDALIALDPLDTKHVQRCNMAEAEFWRRSEGYQTKASDELLQFDCGGQQWVWEVCFPTGTQDHDNGNDMAFMDRLLNEIETNNFPAHAPIEQRWTASSSSFMSPAHGAPDGLHSWVGIIQYLPLDNEVQRQAITERFLGQYCDIMREAGELVNATSHWAKLERPQSLWKLIDLQLLLQSRFPLHQFNQARALLDPKNILGSPTLDLVLGKPKSK